VRAIAPEAGQWRVDDETFDRVVLACAPWDAARLVRASGLPADSWCETTEALRFEAIATVYVRGASKLAEPMLALRSDPATAPAQFVFDRASSADRMACSRWSSAPTRHRAKCSKRK
jgi:predicted NAD/FAD-binding protein